MNGHIEVDESLLQRLPLPLAQLCRRAQNAKTSHGRHQASFYVWETTLKLLASVALVEYADCRDHDPKLVELLKKLARPSLGHWWEFVRRLLPVLAERGDAGFIASRDLILGRARDDMPRAAGLDAALLEELSKRVGAKSTVRLTELIDRLVQYRNREMGHGAAGQRPAEFYDKMARVLFAAATELLGRLDVLAGRRLLFIGEVRRQSSRDWLAERYSLVGESAKRMESLELPESAARRLLRPEQVYLELDAPAGGKGSGPTLHALHPLLHFDANSGLAYFMNARRGQREVEYLCYTSGETIRLDALRVDHRQLLVRVLGQEIEQKTADSWADASMAEEPDSKSLATQPLSLRSIGEFELLSRLGQGGMGVVYRAWQPSLGRQVALKCMLRAGDPKAEARFSREIRALGRVEHRHVVKVFTSGSEGDQWFYAMELIEGAELSRVCEQLGDSSAGDVDEGNWQKAVSSAFEQARSEEKPISKTEIRPARPASPPARTSGLAGGRGHVTLVADLVRMVAEAAHSLHEAGVVHRDIKPGNIMLTGETNHPVLMDLGLAQLADESEGRITRTRQFVGTLRYASPEQILSAGKVDRRTDIYSLGATLWELLTLRPIFDASEETSTPELMLKIQTHEPEKPRKYNDLVPRDLEAIVLKCLEKDRGRRYATAAELSDDLGRFLAGEPVAAQPPSLTYITGKYVRRYKGRLMLAAAMALILVIGLVASFISIDSQRRVAVGLVGQLKEAKDKSEAQTKAAVHLAGQLKVEKDISEAQTKAAVLAKRQVEVKGQALREEAYNSAITIAERELTTRNDVGRAGELLEGESCPSSMRGWEWDYLIRLRDGDRPPLAEHKSGLWMAAFSTNGKHIATVSIDGTLKFWNAETGKLENSIDADEGLITAPVRPLMDQLGISRIPVTCLAFSPDGKHIATGSCAPNPVAAATNPVGVATALGNLLMGSEHEAVKAVVKDASGIVIIWDLKTGESRTFDQQVGLVLSVTYSPDGKRIASSSINPANTFVVWNAETREVIKVVKGHESQVHRLRYSPDGKLLVSSDTDGMVRLWDAETFEEVRSKRAHPAPIIDFSFSPDGRRFATAGDDGLLRVWETATFAPLLELRGHTGSALGIAYSPDGNRIASAGFDKTVRLWDSSTGQEKLTLRGHSNTVWSVAFSPDGRRLVSASFDSTARVWDSTPREERRGPGLFSRVGHSDRVNSIAFSRDGRYLASGGWDMEARLWDGMSGSPLKVFKGHNGAIFGLALSPDGKKLATASWDHKVKVWDTASGRVLVTFSEHTAPVHGVAFSPNGRWVASGGFDGNVKVWDAATGKALAYCDGFIFPVFAVAFSPDGRRLASGGADRSVKIWDAARGTLLETRKGHEASIHALNFSPNGKRLVSASWDQTLRIWDVDPAARSPNLSSLVTLKGHTDRVSSVTYNHDGTRIASGSEDKTVRIWDARNGVEVHDPILHRGTVWSVAYPPDEKRIAAATWSKDGWVKTSPLD
jgi:WD40 repeat protein/serine/threonine protein kinase